MSRPMDELFNVSPERKTLPLAVEQALIQRAQAGDSDATWELIRQYRGALQTTFNRVRAAIRGVPKEQLEDLQSELVLTAVEAVKTFDSTRFVRLSQVLPAKLRDKASEATTALAVPRGTLALWFKIYREAERDVNLGVELAPRRGMTVDTFKAIHYALYHSDSEWVHLPYDPAKVAPDAETYRLAHYALSLLTPTERDVIELVYGFRGEPKPDSEVALIRDTSPRTIKEQRQRAVEKMRAKLAA